METQKFIPHKKSKTKKMTRIFITVVFITSASFLLCTTKNAQAQKTINFEIDDFEEVMEIEGEKIYLKSPLMNPSLILFHDTLLFIKNSDISPAIDVISINSGKTIARFCKKGRGPGELIAPFCIQYLEDEKTIMVQDVSGRKLVFYDLDLVLADAPKKYTKTVNFSEDVFVRKLYVVEGGNYFCNLMGNDDGYMNCLISPEGEIIKFLDKYPKLDVPFNPALGSNIFGPLVSGASSRDKVIMAYSYNKRICIYEASGDMLTEIKGPDYKKLDVVYENGRNYLTSRNNRAYGLACSNSESFMIPFNGNRRIYAFSPANHIFHFGLDGKLLQHLKVEPSVVNIAVDWEKRIIYGINQDLEPCIYKYKF